MTVPESHLLRSPVYRVLRDAGAEFTVLGDAAVAKHFGGGEAESERAQHCGLADLSMLPRIGFKGAGAPEWLQGQGLVLPDQPNSAVRQASGILVARLSHQEHLVLSDLDGNGAALDALASAWSFDSAPLCFPLMRRESHAWFMLSGERMPEMLAKVCGVDLRWQSFAPGRIAQTSVARISAIVIRNDLDGVNAFSILADSASADYLWSCLLDAMTEFDGGPVGLDTLWPLWRGDAA